MEGLRNARFLSFFLLILSLLGNCDGTYYRTRMTSIRSDYTEFIRYSEPIATRADQVYRRSPARRVDESPILFPSSVITLPNPGSIISPGGPSRNNVHGSQCILYGGSTGTCRPAAQCRLLLKNQFQFMQSQTLFQCGQRSGLICCPISAQLTSSTVTTPKSEPEKSAAPSVTKPLQPEPISIVQPPSPDKEVPGTVNIPISGEPPESGVGHTKPTENSSSKQQLFDLEESGELQNVCGVFADDKETGNKLWPWTVSIGQKFDNGSIDWTCLGSLITKEFILTAAVCLQQNSNVIAVGKAFLGAMTSPETRGVDIHRISQVLTHEKFNSPYLYKNIGLLQISSPIFVTPTQLPVCFPFLASVLDIIPFAGRKGTTIGFNIPVRRRTGVIFEFQEYRILNNTQCSTIFTAQQQHVWKRFPFGIKNGNMCGIQRNPGTLCQAPGAPLVIFDTASSTYVQIGVSSGDPTCSELRRQIVTFSRLSFFSSWIRERVGQFPTPPTCYF